MWIRSTRLYVVFIMVALLLMLLSAFLQPFMSVSAVTLGMSITVAKPETEERATDMEATVRES